MADADYTAEIWKTIPFAPDYAVSDMGRIKRVQRSARICSNATFGNPLRCRPRGTSGYLGATMSVGGARLYCYVQRAVLEAFIGPKPSADHEAAHADGDRHNNQLSNLRWATRKENAADRIAHGKQVRGEKVASSKLSVEQVRQIRKGALSGQPTAELFGISKSLVNQIRRRTAWAWLDSHLETSSK